MLERNRIAEMLKSIDENIDYPNDTYSRAAVMRAAIGSVNVPSDESSMLAICRCGWRGTMLEAHSVEYDNGQWSYRAGRRGTHWHCPECNQVIWRYYHTIN